MGYIEGVNGYILLDISTEKIFIKRSVKFKEGPSHAIQEKPIAPSLPFPVAAHKYDSSCSLDKISNHILKFDLNLHEHDITKLDPMH